MAHQVQVNAGVKGIVLPDGRSYDGQVTVTLTDSEFTQIRSALFAGGSPVLTDLGHVAGTSDTFADLGDVVVDSPQVGDTVIWNGQHWINAQPAADIDIGGGSGGGVSFIDKTPFIIYAHAVEPYVGGATITVPDDTETVVAWTSVHDGNTPTHVPTGLTPIPNEAFGSDILPLSDDVAFIAGEDPFTTIFLRTAGLYRVAVAASFDASGVGRRGIKINAGRGHNWIRDEHPPNVGGWPVGDVIMFDVTPGGIGTDAYFTVSVEQTSGDDLGMREASCQIQRVL